MRPTTKASWPLVADGNDGYVCCEFAPIDDPVTAVAAVVDGVDPS